MKYPKTALQIILTILSLQACSSDAPDTEESNLLRFAGEVYIHQGRREQRENQYLITEYKRRNSRIYFVTPNKEISQFLFAEEYKKTFESLGLDVTSIGDEHIGQDKHSIVYIVPSKDKHSLVVLLAVKTREYPENHSDAQALMDELKNLDYLVIAQN